MRQPTHSSNEALVHCANRLFRAVLGALALTGCATLSPDGGFATVQSITKDRTEQEVRWARTDPEFDAIKARVSEILLGSPLTVDDAVRIALINNRGLQATYADVGIGETELVQASWPRNPGFSFTHLQGGGEKEIDRSFTLELV